MKTKIYVAASLLLAAGITYQINHTHAKRFVRSPSQTKSIFDQDFAFECSPLTDVACTGIFPVHAGDGSMVAPLIGGEASLSARLQTLSDVHSSIRIQALVFTGDESGNAVTDRLLKFKEEHPQGLVDITVDAASNPALLTTQELYRKMKDRGIDLIGDYFELLNDLGKVNDPLLINKRYHDKMWVIDAEDQANATAIVGGMNIANEYFRAGPDAAHIWRDQDLIVRGPIVQDIRVAFDRNRTRFHADMSAIYSALEKTMDSKAWHALREAGQKINSAYDKFEDKIHPHDPTLNRVSAIAKVQYDASHPLDLQSMLKPVTMRFIQNRPRLKESFILQAYLDQIGSSNEILIANAYFIPTPKIREALKAAARRGATVKIITNSLETNDLDQMTFAARYLYQELLAVNEEQATKNSGGNLSIYEWQGDKHGEKTIHAKFALFDRERAIVGSYNLDPRSENLNSETVMAIRDEQFVTGMTIYYLTHDLAEMSKQVTDEEAAQYHTPDHSPEKLRVDATINPLVLGNL